MVWWQPGDHAGEIHVRHLRTDEVKVFRVRRGVIFDLQFSQGGSKIFAASSDQGIGIVDLLTKSTRMFDCPGIIESVREVVIEVGNGVKEKCLFIGGTNGEITVARFGEEIERVGRMFLLADGEVVFVNEAGRFDTSSFLGQRVLNWVTSNKQLHSLPL